MLVDQKMNDGIAVPFFGHDVMTAPALAELALRYDCPVVPARVERLRGAHFKMTALPPLEMVRTGNHHADVAAVMAKVNALVEQWIRDTPEQWLWLHNRWPDD
jgi:KDO2-lipid IV(A) lauroyltransferase